MKTIPLPALLSQEITNPALGPGLENKSGLSFFQEAVPRFLALGMVIGTLIFFFILIIGAIQWISSGGDKSALESAKGKLTNAFIGIIILFSLFVLLKVIESFFGITILTLDIGPLIIQ